SCTAALDEMAGGLLAHLHARDTSFAVVARAPYPKVDAYRAKRGWSVPFYSSYGSDFNYDFHVTLDRPVAPPEYNYRPSPDGEDGSSEAPGYSCFLREGTGVYHTYSTFARGTEQLGGAYAFLDMTALGRQEEWEEPKGRAAKPRQARPDFAE